jgi:hypothetical protein
MAKTKISYSWVINALDAKISQDSKDNVVYSVHWNYNANKGDHNASMIGSYGVVYDKDNFIEYDKLKKSDVIKWLEAGLDVDSMKSNLLSQIDKLENPVDVLLRPSW